MKRDEVEEFLAASTGPLDVTPVDVMAALFALLVAASATIALRAIGRRRRSRREPTGRGRSEVERDTPDRTKRKA